VSTLQIHPADGAGRQRPAAVDARLVEFLRFARYNGLAIGAGEQIDALRVAEYCTIGDKQRLCWGLRSLLCSNRREWERFDELFDLFWTPRHIKSASQVSGSSHKGAPRPQPGEGRGGRASEADKRGGEDGDDAEEQGHRSGASAQRSLSRTDFRLLEDAGQMREIERLVEQIARKIRRHITRRRRLADKGERIDLRQTVHRNLGHGGLPLELAFQRRRHREPRLIVLVDASRSMSFYSYLFLRFTRGIIGAFGDAEAFIYHTHLVPVTDALRGSDIDVVKEKMALMSGGFAGGTRIGECLEHFNRDYGRRILNRRTLFIIMSDGLDTSPPELLAGELAYIKSRANRVVWLNPLLGRAGYQPLAGGMQAALPYIDLFAPAHDLESLKALESSLVSV
jgi:uncharacterized protein with von Willebrand factor type A (vWA) domain